MAATSKDSQYRFSFGPWNIHEGADPFGPVTRDSFAFEEKIKMYRKLGYTGVQFHDDDVADSKLSLADALKRAKEVKKMLDGEGLVTEFVAPRTWEDPRGDDGGFTSNDAACRRWAIDRARRTVDIANTLGCHQSVYWPAREGTYCREAKDAALAVDRMIEGINKMLDHDKKLRLMIEPKPNEPMDMAFCPTIGHAIGIAYRCNDPKRVGALVESAHAILANLDPADEMAYAISHKKLWSVHLNDQNGLKFDQDKSFGSANLRRAFNQVWVLDRAGFGKKGEFVGMDVKVMRTQKKERSLEHLKNSREIFLRLLDLVRSLDVKQVEKLRAERDYETLDRMILDHLMGAK